jgi:hypothetical protein
MKPKRALVFGGIALALFLAGGIILAGRDEEPPPQGSPPVIFGRGHAEGRKISTRSWSCEYDKIVASNDQSIMEIDGVHNGVIYREGKPYLRLTATHLRVNSLTKDFTATGKLHVETVDRKKPLAFETDALSWNEGAQVMTVTSPLTFNSESDEPLRVADLTYNVREGTIHLGKSEGAIKL